MQNNGMPATWPGGTGDMARLIREHDWAATPLGPITAWPPSLRAAVDICLGSAVPSYVWWGADLIQLSNDAALLINRAQHPAFLGQPAREAWADVWEEVGGRLEHVVTTGEPVRGDSLPMVFDRDGSRETAWFTCSYAPVRDETGAVAGVFCSAIETPDTMRAHQALQASSERRRIEAELRTSEERLRRMINVDGLGILLLDEAGVLIGANDFFLAMSGYPREVITEHRLHWRDLTPPEYVDETEQQMRQLSTTGRGGPYEKEYLRVDGSRVWMLVASAALGDGTIVKYCLDISDRKRAEAGLRAGEERYRTLFESIDQGFCTIEVLFDPAGQAVDYMFLEINPAFARNTGLGDAVGKRMRELAPAHEEHWFETYGRVALTGKSARFEAEAAALGRWYSVYAYRIGEPDQHRVAVMFEDVTARKTNEAAMRASEERFQTLVQNILDYAIFMLDADGVVTEWPEGAQRVKGYTPEEVIGQHVSLFYPPEELAAGDPARELAEAAATGRAEREAWRLRKGGERFWGNEIATAIRDDAGRLIGFTKITRDLTERRQTEETLREREERLRAIVEVATDYAIFTADVDGRIDGWYAGAEAIFQWTEAEAIGQSMDITYTPEDRDAGVPAQERSIASEQGSAPNVRWHVRRDGTRVFIDGVARARYAADGAFLGILKIGQDTTERRLTRQRQREDEERIRQELARRVAEATRELRILSRRLLAVQEEERRRLALELHDDFGQMLTGLGFTLGMGTVEGPRLAEAKRIVAELTERIRDRSMELRPATLDSYGLLPAVLWHLERYQRQTGITVELLQEGLEQRFSPPVEITAYRIVQEALTNVARHSESKSARVQLFADDVALTVSIQDYGRGFGRASNSGGSGMAGMRERAELVGGTLEIDAVPGEGVTVTVELPLELPLEFPTLGEETREEA